ncbi:MAG: YigZ family protein [Flavobacteriaceae bacterium]|nr:YigZ family protein [Flavobacteriaceae bacterium]
MVLDKDVYKTIDKASTEALFKDRGSKFYGYAFPVTNEEEIKENIEFLKKQHYNARHWCYAWQLGMKYEKYRANDDGEPTNSAGTPIYGQLQAFEVTNILVVVVRYFGGTKLGVGGLIQAYKTTAKFALENSEIIQKTINEKFILQFNYSEMNKVMRIVKEEQISIINQKLDLNCMYTISVRKKEADKVFKLFNETYKVLIKKKDN